MKLGIALAWITVAVSAADVSTAKSGNAYLITHEWGTFTSVAGEDGYSVNWAPLYGAPDLPCFVARLGSGTPVKWALSGLVRMETPVLYFYSDRPQTVSVHVDFPNGLITEWFPRASNVTPSTFEAISGFRHSSIEWNNVSVLPDENLSFPSGKEPSRYYAARATDAAALRIGDQQEKFIFYRGVGGFQVPLRPKYTPDGKLELRSAAPDPVSAAILFENHEGRIGYRMVRGLDPAVTLDPPELTEDSEHVRQDLMGVLISSGLSEKEARAMLQTWSDSWFEEGTRIIYIVPRTQVDALLPLRISPSPAEIRRVFVGRIEVLSPGTRHTLLNAASSNDAETLEKFARFLGVFTKRVALPGPALQRALNDAAQKNAAACIP
jgi:hypothetical protein